MIINPKKTKSFSDKEIDEWVEANLDYENKYAFCHIKLDAKRIVFCEKCNSKIVFATFFTKDKKKKYLEALNVFDKADRWFTTEKENLGKYYEATLAIDNRYVYYENSKHTKEICERMRKENGNG